MIRVVFYFAILTAGVVLAYWKGDRSTKRIALILVLGNLASAVIENAGIASFAYGSWLYFGLDAILLLLICSVTVASPSWLGICVAAFQLNGTFGHLVKIVQIETLPLSYALLLKIWAWPMVIALLLASFTPKLSRTLFQTDWPFRSVTKR